MLVNSCSVVNRLAKRACINDMIYHIQLVWNSNRFFFLHCIKWRLRLLDSVAAEQFNCFESYVDASLIKITDRTNNEMNKYFDFFFQVKNLKIQSENKDKEKIDTAMSRSPSLSPSPSETGLISACTCVQRTQMKWKLNWIVHVRRAMIIGERNTDKQHSH